MRDIIKYVFSLLATIIIVIVVSKLFSKEEKNSNENRILNSVKNNISRLTEQSFLNCFNQTAPVMANINEEYSKIAKEDDHSKQDILQGILETQISSIKSIENLENEKDQEQVVTENTSPQEQAKNEINQNVEVAKTGVKTEVITNNPITE